MSRHILFSVVKALQWILKYTIIYSFLCFILSRYWIMVGVTRVFWHDQRIKIKSKILPGAANSFWHCTPSFHTFLFMMMITWWHSLAKFLNEHCQCFFRMNHSYSIQAWQLPYGGGIFMVRQLKLFNLGLSLRKHSCEMSKTQNAHTHPPDPGAKSLKTAPVFTFSLCW